MSSPSWDPVRIERADYERADEPMGTKEKFWVQLPDDDRLWLFKLARERDGSVRGEDWAEWVVHHLATLFGVPSAAVRPALWGEHRGIVSRAMHHGPDEQLVHGNSVLFGHDPGYDKQAKRENPGYTPAVVRSALTGVLGPASESVPAGLTGYDVWAGYLVLDAWIAGRDRHHENWALIRTGAERRLAPSFDHGNALGFAELALGALSLATPMASQHWIACLEAVDGQAVRGIADAVPQNVMSGVTRTFVIRLLEANRRRVLDGYRAAQSG